MTKQDVIDQLTFAKRKLAEDEPETVKRVLNSIINTLEYGDLED